MEKLIDFDMAKYLDSPAAVAEYLTQVLEDGDAAEMVTALGHVARAKGMAQIAEQSGLGRESLYKALKEGAKPRFETVAKVLRAAGVRLVVEPADAPRCAGRVPVLGEIGEVG